MKQKSLMARQWLARRAEDRVYIGLIYLLGVVMGAWLGWSSAIGAVAILLVWVGLLVWHRHELHQAERQFWTDLERFSRKLLEKNDG